MRRTVVFRKRCITGAGLVSLIAVTILYAVLLAPSYQELDPQPESKAPPNTLPSTGSLTNSLGTSRSRSQFMASSHKHRVQRWFTAVERHQSMLNNITSRVKLERGMPPRLRQASWWSHTQAAVQKLSTAVKPVPSSQTWRLLNRTAISDVVSGKTLCSSVDNKPHVSCEWNVPLGLLAQHKSHRPDDAAWHVVCRNDEVLLYMRSEIPYSVAEFIADEKPSAAAAEDTTIGLTNWYANPLQCLAAGSSDNAPLNLIFFGHSHSRMIAALLCMMWHLPDCDMFRRMIDHSNLERETIITSRDRGHVEPFTNVAFPPVKIQFVTSLFEVQPRLKSLMEGVQRTLSSPDRRLTVVYNRGPWDLVFTDTPMSTFMRQTTEGLLSLHASLPEGVPLVVYLQHMTQPIARSVAKTPWQAVLRNTCMSETRVKRVRNATLCAIKHAAVLNPSLLDRIQLFDVWRETSALPAELDRFVDYGGHHYMDAVLENLVMKFMRQHVCFSGFDAQHQSISQRAIVDVYLHQIDDDTCRSMERVVIAQQDECGCRGPHRNEVLCTRYGQSGPPFT